MIEIYINNIIKFIVSSQSPQDVIIAGVPYHHKHSSDSTYAAPSQQRTRLLSTMHQR